VRVARAALPRQPRRHVCAGSRRRCATSRANVRRGARDHAERGAGRAHAYFDLSDWSVALVSNSLIGQSDLR
jgi:hypothetical protein